MCANDFVRNWLWSSGDRTCKLLRVDIAVYNLVFEIRWDSVLAEAVIALQGDTLAN
jgi:hypothetical protein